jgi:hypothetical protein
MDSSVGPVAYLLGLPVGSDGGDVLVSGVDRSDVLDDLVLASPNLGVSLIVRA